MNFKKAFTAVVVGLLFLSSSLAGGNIVDEKVDLAFTIFVVSVSSRATPRRSLQRDTRYSRS